MVFKLPASKRQSVSPLEQAATLQPGTLELTRRNDAASGLLQPVQFRLEEGCDTRVAANLAKERLKQTRVDNGLGGVHAGLAYLVVQHQVREAASGVPVTSSMPPWSAVCNEAALDTHAARRPLRQPSTRTYKPPA